MTKPPLPILDYRSPQTSNWTRLRISWLLYLIVMGGIALIVLSLSIYFSHPLAD
jgi:hypothetical protein